MSALVRIALCSMFIVVGTTGQVGAVEQGNKERLVAGVTIDIPGMGYKNPKTGVIGGFEPGVARAVAEKVLGAPGRVDFVQVLDDQRIKDLQDGGVDIVVSQFTITPSERRKWTSPFPTTSREKVFSSEKEVA